MLIAEDEKIMCEVTKDNETVIEEKYANNLNAVTNEKNPQGGQRCLTSRPISCFLVVGECGLDRHSLTRTAMTQIMPR